MANLKLSILDQSPIPAGDSPADAIAASLQLAQHCDQLGYQRYWLAEHHSNPALAGSNPEILIARIAALTKNMRIGAGGVMLNNYAPVKVAENYKVLHSLYPGRIDFGLGRPIDSNQRTSSSRLANRDPAEGTSYLQKIRQLLGNFNDGIDSTTTHNTDDQPPKSGVPEIWLLGSSIKSAGYAAELGLPFSFAHFINRGDGVKAMEFYRRQYTPVAAEPKPQGSISVFVICAETQMSANNIALSHAGFLVDQRTRIPGPIPTPQAVRDTPYTPPQRRLLEAHLKQTIAGPPDTIKRELTALATTHGVEELVIVTITHDFHDRLRSYELLADLF